MTKAEVLYIKKEICILTHLLAWLYDFNGYFNPGTNASKLLSL